MEISISRYNDSMQKQVIDLFAAEYKVEPLAFTVLFEKFYLSAFQKNKCLLVVALDGETVAGFQSFFYWPYTYQGKTFHSYQSGNSLVHPGYRGKGIFNKMLAFIEKENKTEDIDFLMGFPVEASLKNFLKDKWENILNLRWYVKVGNPLGFSGSLSPNSGFTKGCSYLKQYTVNEQVFCLSADRDFTGWRNEYLTGNYYSFTYKEQSHEIVFHLKLNKRKKVLNELIIGNVLFNTPQALSVFQKAIKTLKAKALASFAVHFLSVALNEESSFNLKTEFEKAGFKRSKKFIYFIVKSFKNNQSALLPANWNLFRSDIDTW